MMPHWRHCGKERPQKESLDTFHSSLMTDMIIIDTILTSLFKIPVMVIVIKS